MKINELLINIIRSSITHFILLVLSLFTSILLTRNIGVELRGILSWIMSFYFLGVTFAPLGIGLTSRKVIAKNRKLLPFVFWISNLFCFFGSIFIITILTHVIENNEAAKQYFLIKLIIVLIPFGALSNVYGEVLVGVNYGNKYNRALIFQKIIYVLGINIVILCKQISLQEILIIFSLSILAKFVYSFHSINKELISLRVKNIKHGFKIINATLNYTICSYISFLSLYLIRNINIIILGMHENNIELGLYSSSFIIIETTFILPQMTTLYLLPKLFNKQQTEQEKEEICKWIILIILIICIIASAILNIFAKPIVLLLYGQSFKDVIPTFKALALSIPFFSIGLIYHTLLLYKSKYSFILIPSIVSLLLSVIMIKYNIRELNSLSCSFIFMYSCIVFYITSIVSYLSLNKNYKNCSKV